MSEQGVNTRVPEELVDRFFDRELDEGSREKLFGMLRADLSQCAEVAKTQRMIGMLREPVEAPDLTARIMARVERKQGFLSARLRRFVTAGRLAAAACVLIGVLTIAVVRRVAPEMLRLTPVSQPLSDVIESGKSEAASMQQLAGSVVVVKVAPEAKVAAKRPVVAMGPGRVAVWTLPQQSGGDHIALALGAGSSARFVLQPGGCIDRETSASVAVTGDCPRGEAQAEAIEQFIRKMVESVRQGQAGVGGGVGGGANGASALDRGSRR